MLSNDNDSLQLEYHGKITREEQEKLFAVKAILGRPDIVNNVMAFEKLCFALNQQIPSFEHMERPDSLLVFGALHEIGKQKIAIPTNESVRKYIACILFDDGYVIAPSIASFVQKELDQMVSDHAKELFHGLTVKDLLERKDIEDLHDPISFQAQKHHAVELMLAEMSKS